MSLSSRRRGGANNGLDAWPGYVDALSTLLMVIIFVLLVFVLGQAFLSVALTGKDRALDKLGRQVAELSDMLSLERGRARDLESSNATLGRDLSAAQNAQASLAASLADAETQAGDSAARAAQLQGSLDAAAARGATLAQQVAALGALRDDLQRQVAEAAARSAAAEQQGTAAAARLTEEQAYSDGARAQIALLNHQLEQLRAQMQQTAAALDLQAAQGRDKDAQIAALGQKLNVALASKVEELQRYRSEFFGRLRAVLADRPGIQVVGDRFVFQSEVLFPGGSATLSPAGEEQVRTLATTLKGIVPEIPADIAWLLRVDGHADHDPITGGPFASNWELSSQRAITVVKLLITSGIPAEHLAATGFADFQPLQAGSTPDAYARNRRIELRLTDR